jgi:malonate decarboxylase alpha subunit
VPPTVRIANEAFGDKNAPLVFGKLDAYDLAASAGFALPPVMIYGDDVTHIVTEEGSTLE